MDIAHAGLKQQPFHERGEPVVLVHYRSEQAAHSFLQMISTSDQGIGLFIGSESSGKKTIIRQFVRSLPMNLAVAIVNGSRSNATDLLAEIHFGFGYKAVPESADFALNELKEFIVQQARDSRVPLLVVDNVNEMHPSALRVLCQLAEIKLQGKFALRILLISNKPSFNIIHAPAMTAIAVRLLSAFELGPMTARESLRYLYAKLRTSGCVSPDSVMPADICDELHKASRGWPGILDSLATKAMERARNWPIQREHIYPPAISVVRENVDPEVQKLYVTLNRETLQEFEMKESKVLIGRSELCDVCVNSRFVSKYHALLIRGDDAMHLVDLHSTNGTFVNSERVQSRVLQHDDVISLGNHGIKLIAPAYRAQGVSEESNLADTTTMKTLTELRHLTEDTQEETVPARQQELE